VGDEIVLAVGANADFADGQPLAELDQACLGNEIARRGLLRKLMVRLVVTASGTQPIAESTAIYIAKSASDIMVAPDSVPPGRSEFSLNG
jgi:hypothetical protein